MRPLDAVLKRDPAGNYPRWWQWFFPRHGAWGGPGWSGRRWNPTATDWTCPAIDAMDALFREHDRAYQTGGDRSAADRELVKRLARLRAAGAGAYRLGAMACFTVWPRLRRLARLAFRRREH